MASIPVEISSELLSTGVQHYHYTNKSITQPEQTNSPQFVQTHGRAAVYTANCTILIKRYMKHAPLHPPYPIPYPPDAGI
jgi:hypothetical protein